MTSKKIYFLGAEGKPPIKVVVSAGSPEDLLMQKALAGSNGIMVPNSWVNYSTNDKLAICFNAEDRQIRESIAELVKEAHGNMSDVTLAKIIAIVAGTFKLASASNLKNIPAAPITYHLMTEVIKNRHLPAKAITGDWLYTKRHDRNLKPHDLRNEFNRHPIYVDNMTQRIAEHIGLVKFMRYIHHLVNDAIQKAEKMQPNHSEV